MKKLLILIVALVVSCKPVDCDKSSEIFRGNHKLRKFKVKSEKYSGWSASYFIIGGHASGSSGEKRMVSFCWLMNNGEYAMSEIEPYKIRLKIDSTITEPYVKFRWFHSHSTDVSFITERVNYMVVCCKEEDFPAEINISEL